MEGDTAAQGEEAPGETDETNLVFTEDLPEDTQLQQDTSSVWTYVSVLLVLAVIVAGIYVLFYFMKKAQAVRYGDSDEIRVVSSRALSNTRHLFIIEIGNEFSLIGSAENGITHLKDLSDPETIDRLRMVSSEKPTSGRERFQDILSSLMPGRSRRTEENSNTSSKSALETETAKTFLKRQQDRLKKL